MKNLNRNQSIAVFIAVALVAYLLFGGPLMEFLNPSSEGSTNNQDEQMTQQEGFSIQELSVGTGPVAEAGDTLTVHYIGTLTDGRVFDSSIDRGSPFVFVLGTGGVIRGWDEGMVGMRAGGKRLLTISPEYGYGPAGMGPVPPNSTLVFEVELLDVEKR